MKISWSVDDIFVAEISEREMVEDRTGDRSSYKVIKFRQKKGEKRTCLCFNDKLSQKFGIGLCCSLKGEISFSSGSTYLVVHHVETVENSISTAAP